MRAKRTNDKYAPILTEEKYNPVEKEKMVIKKTVPLREFKFKDKWINYQLDGLFKSWSDVK